MQSTGARFHVHKIRKCESTEGQHIKRRLVDATSCSRLPFDRDVDDDDDGQSSSSSSSAAMVLQLSQVKPLPSCTRQKARSNFSAQEIAQGIEGFVRLSEVLQQLTSLRCPRVDLRTTAFGSAQKLQQERSNIQPSAQSWPGTPAALDGSQSSRDQQHAVGIRIGR